jgi:hypothetical protein
MSNPGTTTFLTTATVARLHHKVQPNATWAIADAKQHRDLVPVQSLRSDVVSHLPPLTPEPMPQPEPTPEREPEPLPGQDPEPKPEQEPLWSLPPAGFRPTTEPAPSAAVAAALQ